MAVTWEEEMTKVLNTARSRLPPTKEQGGRGWGSGSRETPVSTSVPCQSLVPRPQAREGRGPPVARHSPCKASLALASSCSFWTSWTLSSVAERTSEDLPPCDSSKSFVSISFICRRRWTSSWSRDTSSRRSTRGEGHRVRARGHWLRLAHFFWGQFEGLLSSPICSAFGSFFNMCVKRKPPKPPPIPKGPRSGPGSLPEPAERAWWAPHSPPDSLGPQHCCRCTRSIHSNGPTVFLPPAGRAGVRTKSWQESASRAPAHSLPRSALYA